MRVHLGMWPESMAMFARWRTACGRVLDHDAIAVDVPDVTCASCRRARAYREAVAEGERAAE